MQMRIGGRDVAAADDRWMAVLNPATGDVVDHVPEGTIYEVDDAVRAADAAHPWWASRTARERGSVLLRGASLVRERHRDISRILTMEQGKPLRESIDEVRGFANVLEYFAGIAGTFSGEYIGLGTAGDAIVTREPLGVCGAIIPWNMPALLMSWKVAPALLAGNTVVLKPASRTPLAVSILARTLEEAGLPPSVLNVVTGKGDIVGEAIVRHPGIRKVSFTGNVETGLRVRELAAGSLKEITLELGGSDPMIVWKDADIDSAVAGAVRGRFYNAGQTCTAVKRLFVHEAIETEFLRRLHAAVEALAVGNGLDEGIDMGPLCGTTQRDEIKRVMDDFKRKGEGTILTGGEPLRGPLFDRGSFFAPTVVTDVHPESALLKKEVFGPVLPVMRVHDLDIAIEHANETTYGLGASIWTRDISIAREVFSRVQAGVVWVNRHLTLPPEIPFGGVKSSGVGRENGSQALLSYTRTKSLYVGR